MSSMINSLMNTNIVTIHPLDSVRKAEDLMTKKKIGCLPVIENDQLIGIITSRDLRCSHPNRLVIDAMTRNPICINEKASLWDAKKLLNTHNIERLPVISKHGNLIGVITKSTLNKELGKYFDILTGLKTSELLINESLNLLDKNQDIVVLFFDLNNFGKFNKIYGHIIGDEIIKEFSKLLSIFINENNLCRYGGDEFAAILPYKVNKAKLIAQAILSEISRNKWSHNVTISVSIGIAGGRRDDVRDCKDDIIDNIKNLLNLASLASTKAKKQKNNIAVADAIQFSVS